MECLRDVSWDYKGAGGIDTAAAIGGGVQTETNLLIIIIIRNYMKFIMGLLIQVNYQVGGMEMMLSQNILSLRDTISNCKLY